MRLSSPSSTWQAAAIARANWKYVGSVLPCSQYAKTAAAAASGSSATNLRTRRLSNPTLPPPSRSPWADNFRMNAETLSWSDIKFGEVIVHAFDSEGASEGACPKALPTPDRRAQKWALGAL